MTLRDALNTAGASAVSVCFMEDFRKEHSDRHEALNWTLTSESGGYDLVRRLGRSTFAGDKKLLDMEVKSFSPKSAYRAYYGDHDVTVSAKIAIFVELPVQYYKEG
jgi:hypothetical protein